MNRRALALSAILSPLTLLSPARASAATAKPLNEGDYFFQHIAPWADLTGLTAVQMYDVNYAAWKVVIHPKNNVMRYVAFFGPDLEDTWGQARHAHKMGVWQFRKDMIQAVRFREAA